MVKHLLHVFVGEAKSEQRHCTHGFNLNRIIVEHFKVLINLLDANAVEVNGHLFGPLASWGLASFTIHKI